MRLQRQHSLVHSQIRQEHYAIHVVRATQHTPVILKIKLICTVAT